MLEREDSEANDEKIEPVHDKNPNLEKIVAAVAGNDTLERNAQLKMHYATTANARATSVRNAVSVPFQPSKTSTIWNPHS